MNGLKWGYSRWKRDVSGIITVQYMIFGFLGPYVFPSEDKINEKADEIFLKAKQVPKKIRINDDSIIFFFAQKVFQSKKDYEARTQFFDWIINNTRKA